MIEGTNGRQFEVSGIERGADGVARYSQRPSSLVAMLRASVERDPGAEAIVEQDGRRVTYRELWDQSARVAGGLRSEGVARGDRVAIRLPNGLDWCLAFFGIQLAGAVAVPVNARLTEAEVAYIVEDSEARFSFLPSSDLPQGDPFVVDDLEPEHLAAIFYTSGTTGFPKGAMTTHANFLANTENARRVMGLPPVAQFRNLVSVPLFHVTGCNSQLLVSCELGSTTVIMPTFEVQAFLRAITQERIDLLTSVPAIYWLAASQPNFGDFDVSGVRWVNYGGAPIAPELVRRITEAFPNARVGNGFGLTETSSIATFLPHEYAKTRPESVGFAAPVVDLDLASVDSDTGVGELLIRGPNVVSGYWNKPSQTADTFVDHWLHSGDLARIDEQGLVEIVDRAKDMINRGGENVYCVEVENVLSAHPKVFEAAVVGVADEVMGEKVGAVIVPRPGQTVDAGDLVEFTRSQLADFKTPEYVLIRQEALPRNPGGKLVKPSLRDTLDWSSAQTTRPKRAKASPSG